MAAQSRPACGLQSVLNCLQSVLNARREERRRRKEEKKEDEDEELKGDWSRRFRIVEMELIYFCYYSM
jgi:hypothetical protein